MNRVLFVMIAIFSGISIMGCGSRESDFRSNSDDTVSSVGVESQKNETEQADSVGFTENDTSTDKSNAESEDDFMNKNSSDLSAIRVFMMEEYGLSEEELEGYDLIRLMDDYDFREMDYTTEEVREILADQGEYYKDTGYTELFYFLNAEEGGNIKDAGEVQRIGFLYNEGTIIRRVVYDLKEEKIYDDSTESVDMTKEQVQKLSTLVDDYRIYEWDNRYFEGDKIETTGSLGWKIVFECTDGSECVYGGYTRDMSNLPDHFSEVTDTLLGMTEE